MDVALCRSKRNSSSVATIACESISLNRWSMYCHGEYHSRTLQNHRNLYNLHSLHFQVKPTLSSRSRNDSLIVLQPSRSGPFGSRCATDAPQSQCNLISRVEPFYRALFGSQQHTDLLNYLDAIADTCFTGWHCDAIDFSDRGTLPVGARAPPSYDYVRYYRDISGFAQTKAGWSVRTGSNSETAYVLVPRTKRGFIVPGFALTQFGAIFDAFSGLPRCTTPDRRKAIAAWRDVGLTAESAIRHLSVFSRQLDESPSSEVAGVYSGSFPPLFQDLGPMFVGLTSPDSCLFTRLCGYFLSRSTHDK